MRPTVQSYEARRKAASEFLAKFQVRAMRVRPGASTAMQRTSAGKTPSRHDSA